jgi:sugar lactone lactonase YvrE
MPMLRPLRAGLAAALVLLAPLAQAAPTVTVIARGLVNPRGLAFAPNGALYVAEAGSGGSGRCIPAPDDPTQSRCYGETGALTRVDPTGTAAPVRVVTGLPSMAAPGGVAASSGPVDVDFFGMQAYVVVGWGGDPAARAGVGPRASEFGSVLRVLPSGRVESVADVSAHETAANPYGGRLDSNPYGILALPGRLIVADAGMNAIVETTAHRQGNASVNTFATLPPTVAGLEPVPTSVAAGPDGAVYAGQLTGAPFLRGTAAVYRIPPGGGTPVVYARGFSAIVDLAFDASGTLYVLEIARGLVPGPGANPGVGQGRLLRVKSGQAPEVVLDGLVFPGGVAIGPDGAAYVTNFGIFPGGGQVLRVTLDE